MEVSQQELDQAYKDLNKAEMAFVRATLRLRALQGHAIMQVGDSFNVAAIALVMDELGKEFGARNLRVF